MTPVLAFLALASLAQTGLVVWLYLQFERRLSDEADHRQAALSELANMAYRERKDALDRIQAVTLANLQHVNGTGARPKATNPMRAMFEDQDPPADP